MATNQHPTIVTEELVLKLGAYASKNLECMRLIAARNIPVELMLSGEIGFIPPMMQSMPLLLRGRMTVTLRDQYNRLIGIAGRKLESMQGIMHSYFHATFKESDSLCRQWDAKWINDKYVDRRRLLFGLNNAAQAIRESDTAILVEGYLDQIVCRLNGVENTVATCGTALTTEQLSILRRYCRKIAIMYDGDAGGWNAAEKHVERILEFDDMNVLNVILPSGLDPDDLILKGKGDRLVKAINNLLSENRKGELSVKI